MKKQVSMLNQGLADFCNLTALYLGLTAYGSISLFSKRSSAILSLDLHSYLATACKTFSS